MVVEWRRIGNFEYYGRFTGEKAMNWSDAKNRCKNITNGNASLAYFDSSNNETVDGLNDYFRKKFVEHNISQGKSYYNNNSAKGQLPLGKLPRLAAIL